MKNLVIPLIALFVITVQAKEYHVSVYGNDNSTGCIQTPFRSINKAAMVALPGDTITVHSGTYREWINPVYGGENFNKCILYRSATGDSVIIKGSEIINGWKKVKNNVWCCTIDNSILGADNPFSEVLIGDWLDNPQGIHRADIFLDDVSMYEVQSIDKVYTPDTIYSYRDPKGTLLVWYAQVDSLVTKVYANFDGGINPNNHLTEASIRPTCFYPTRENLNYITIRGFTFTQAATRWAPPTAEQVGMVATNWSKGWIIENNIFRNSKCSGLTMGKEAATGNNTWMHAPQIDGALHYIEAVFNVLRKGWDKDVIGSHIVRNNEFSNCEQTGMCGSMGAVFSEIYNNYIHDTWVKRQFNGAEIGGIKLHGSIDVYIHNNRINGNQKGIWLDWMNQGCRVSCNIMYDNHEEDLFCEVDHGPYMIDNNIMLSKNSILECSDGGAFVHNIISGGIRGWKESRYTPYQLNHSTQVKGLSTIPGGDHRYINNIFGMDALATYKDVTLPVISEDNEQIKCKMEETEKGLFIVLDKVPSKGRIVDTKRLGTTFVTRYQYENPDGTPITINKDYFGDDRLTNTPTIGPFEIQSTRIKVF